LVKVALVQFDSVPEKGKRNLRKMEELAERACQLGARWIVFHECTVTDYTPKVRELAENVPHGPSTRFMIDIAKRQGSVLSYGLIETEGRRYYITQAFVSPSGFEYRYRKTWLWRSETDEGFRNEWARFDPGPGPQLFTIDGRKATCFICADGSAPRCIERARLLGPDVVFYPNNRGSLPSHEVLGDLARRIGAPMLVTNRVGASWNTRCQGGCAAYSKEGRVLAEANRDGEEEILLGEI
jgi:predicted amidohydrolase